MGFENMGLTACFRLLADIDVTRIQKRGRELIDPEGAMDVCIVYISVAS